MICKANLDCTACTCSMQHDTEKLPTDMKHKYDHFPLLDSLVPSIPRELGRFDDAKQKHLTETSSTPIRRNR
jgi:hypothetical protein